MPSTLATPQTYAQGLLDVVAAALVATAGGAITRAFVSAGLPAIDCVPQLTVHVASSGTLPTRPIGPLDDGHSRRYGLVRTITFWTTIARCAPLMGEKGQPPSMATQTAIADIVNQDGWAAVNAIYDADRAGLLFDGACSEVYHDGASPLDPAGGALGWVIRTRASVQGTAP